MEKIIVKQIENSENALLTFKHPGAKEFLPVRVGLDGKVITGFDENALYIVQMEDTTAKAELQKRIKTERTSLEKLLNVSLDVNSPFWDEFNMVLDDELQLDPTNPMDRLRERWLVANHYVAPNEESTKDDEDYQHCVYYLFRNDEEVGKQVNVQMVKDKAISKLVTLKEENPNKLILVVSNLLGYSSELNITAEQAYVKAKEFLALDDKPRKNTNTNLFLSTVEKSPEELGTKLILDKAIKGKVISTRGNVFRRGEVEYGRTYEEALEYLLAIENSGELRSLKKEISIK